MGAFVTLKRGELLRGCCGVLGKPMTVGSAISNAALRTAKEDGVHGTDLSLRAPLLAFGCDAIRTYESCSSQRYGSSRCGADWQTRLDDSARSE